MTFLLFSQDVLIYSGEEDRIQFWIVFRGPPELAGDISL